MSESKTDTEKLREHILKTNPDAVVINVTHHWGEPVVVKPSDASLLLKIRDEYVKPNAKVGTNAYLCSFLSQTADRIEQLESENAELRRQRSEGTVCGNCEHKTARAFLEKQIADGELVPLPIAIQWIA